MNLLDLPDEILLDITTYVDDITIRPTTTELESPSPLLSLSLVCRRLGEIAGSCLYQELEVHFDLSDQSGQENRPTCYDLLRRTLEEQPSRWSLVRDLDVYLKIPHPPHDQSLQDAISFLSQCSNVRLYEIECSRYSDLKAGGFIEALQTEWDITQLTSHYVVIEDLFQPGLLDELDKLNCSSIASRDDREDWWDGYELPSDLRGTSSLTDLEVDMTEDLHPYTIIPILRWAASMEYLVLKFDFDSNRFLGNFSASQLQHILDIHSDNLESITITVLRSEMLPDFRHFSMLITLDLSWMALFNTQPAEAALKLSAPSLEMLFIDGDLDYDPDDDSDDDDDDTYFVKQVEFDASHASWLDQFVDEFLRLNPENELEEIHMRCSLDADGKSKKALEETRAGFEAKNITFTWRVY